MRTPSSPTCHACFPGLQRLLLEASVPGLGVPDRNGAGGAEALRGGGGGTPRDRPRCCPGREGASFAFGVENLEWVGQPRVQCRCPRKRRERVTQGRQGGHEKGRQTEACGRTPEAGSPGAGEPRMPGLLAGGGGPCAVTSHGSPGLRSPEPPLRVGPAAGTGSAPSCLALGTASWLAAAGVQPEGSRPTWLVLAWAQGSMISGPSLYCIS